MKIKKLILPSANLLETKQFYIDRLGFQLLEQHASYLSIKIGWTELIFQHDIVKKKYHYCFLLPSNQFEAAFDWFSNHHTLLEIQPNQFTVYFEDWNAHSFYFYDNNNNLLECIVHHDITLESNTFFSMNSILGINEIGLGSNSIQQINQQLESQVGSLFWKGDLMRFATNGDQYGRILLPAIDLKKNWFPTSIPIKPNPFNLWIEHANRTYNISYKDNEISILQQN